MTPINRQYQIFAVAEKRTQQAFDPGRFQGGRFRRNDRACTGLKQIGSGENRVKSHAISRSAFVLGADAMQCAQRVQVGSGAEMANSGGPDQALGAIARAPVRVDDYRPLAWKILQQSGTDCLNYLSDAFAVVVS